MIGKAESGFSFPKKFRLLKSSEYRFPKPFGRFSDEYFRFFFCESEQGRLGISVSKRVLKTSVARNRLKRLIREVYRTHRNGLEGWNLHVVGGEGLRSVWRELGSNDVLDSLERLKCNLSRRARKD